MEVITEAVDLSPYQKALLKKALKECEGLEFIGNDIFNEADAETRLFSVVVPAAKYDWYARFVNALGKAPTPEASTVLTKEQETALFLQYNFSKKELLDRVKAYQSLAVDEREAAFGVLKWHKKVIDLRQELVGHNLALVLGLVRKFSGSNLDFDEMLSEGNTILLNAINKFNAGLGNKFSTYATWSVTRAFGKASKKKDRGNKMFPVSLDLELQKSDYVDRKHEEQVNDGVLLLREILANNTAGLTEEEMAIIIARHPRDASDEFKAPTLEVLGQKFGKNKSNMSRIEKKALEKIRLAFKRELV